MLALLKRYTRWLHTQWPAGKPETMPEVHADGSTNVPGLYVTGDLTGIPLLKFAADTGARAVRTIAADPAFLKLREEAGAEPRDLVIVGGGVSGMAAALEAREKGLDFVVLESSEPFSTIVNFPKAKPIYTYPTDMTPAGELQPSADVKEALVEELREQAAGIGTTRARVERIVRAGDLLSVELAEGEPIRARRAIVAIGQSGDFRRLDVPGEDLPKVYNRLHDPADYAGQDVLVVGGGDSAAETATALAQAGARVTLSYRKSELSRPKAENVERLQELSREGAVDLRMPTQVRSIGPDSVTLDDGSELPNDSVFPMIGREAPLDFFRRSGVKLRGETSALGWIGIVGFLVAMYLLYDWKNEGFVSAHLVGPDAFPKHAPGLVASLGDWWSARVADRSTLVGTIAVSMKSRSFYYTLLYTLTIGAFGWRRIRRRKTPYVTAQMTVLFLVQLLPLFLLPEIFLPWLGYNGAFDSGGVAALADGLFEKYIPDAQYAAHDWPAWGHPRAYWRAYGLVLAWPLMVYNVFTEQPITAWLVISLVQTFVIIPWMVWRWGKGAFCGWICSCGGLAESLGDTQRHKMLHGPFWNRFNMLGQALLGVAFVMLVVRVLGWILPGSLADRSFGLLLDGNPLSWKWTVDFLLAGVLGVGLYFKYSGRMWCRFACPLAALMHVYARFTQFRIFADKKKCISCDVCTTVCHQGIDVMNFANKGLPMEDPECVRCSACVQSCPTGVLEFGRIDRKTGKELARDRLVASPVREREG